VSNRYDVLVRDAWAAFESGLAATLYRLGGADLFVCSPGARGATLVFVCEAADMAFSAGLFEDSRSAEPPFDSIQRQSLDALGWNSSTDHYWGITASGDEVSWLTSVAVDTFRHVFGVEHPRFLIWEDA
jgi:hypothetical protein